MPMHRLGAGQACMRPLPCRLQQAQADIAEKDQELANISSELDLMQVRRLHNIKHSCHHLTSLSCTASRQMHDV